MPTLELNPTIAVDRSHSGTLRIRSGTGWTRGRFELSTDGELALRAILASEAPWTLASLVEAAQSVLHDERSALDLVQYLRDEQILVPEGDLADEARLTAAWAGRGWRTPAIHHLAGFGMRFMPDDRGGADYDDIYAEMLSDPAAPPQPGAIRGVPEGALFEVPLAEASFLDPGLSVQSVLENAKQVYAFDRHVLPFSLVHGILAATFTNQRYQKTGLGPAAMRSYPSGGSRHPLEVYLLTRRSDGERPAGVYYFAPDGGGLHLLREDHEAASELDRACFLKRGVRSSDFAVLISVRWLRHMWKYRYARSYRMVLLEVGHALQSLSFAAGSQLTETYYCPSYNDSELNRLCGLSDPFDESIGVVMTLGRHGLTLEQYRERYDTNA